MQDFPYPVHLRIGEGLHRHVHTVLAANIIASGGQQGHLLDAPLPWISCDANKARLVFGHLTGFSRKVVQIKICCSIQQQEMQQVVELQFSSLASPSQQTAAMPVCHARHDTSMHTWHRSPQAITCHKSLLIGATLIRSYAEMKLP